MLKIPPAAKVVAMLMTVLINEKNIRDVRINANCGCDGGPTAYFELKSDKNIVLEAYKKLLQKRQKGESTTDDLYPFAKLFWGLETIPNGPIITSDSTT